MPKTDSAVAKSKKAGELASSGKSRKAAEDAKSHFTGHENLHKWEVESVGQYQGHLYEPVNEYLRGIRTSILSDYGEHIPRLDKAIAKTSFAKDVTLYRGAQPYPGMDFRELKPGHVIEDKGFHSTTINRGVAEKFVGVASLTGTPGALITIKASKGQKGLAVHKVDTGSKYQSGPHAEHEVLLPRGSTFKVLSVKPRKDGNVHVTVRLQ